jgi:hypothetical protein
MARAHLLRYGRRVGEEVDVAVMSWFDQEMDRTRREGEGHLLLKQLRLRFGELPATVVARVETAEVAEIEVWAERFVTATRLEDVLDS